MALTGFHLRVARLLGQATESEGFALGGGYGLQSHGLVDRPSEDLDAYVDKFDPEVFDRAEKALMARIEADGLQAEIVKQLDVMRAIKVTGAEDETVVVDLGYDYRDHPPVRIENIGPVLDVEDIVNGKVRAFIERGRKMAVERDYYDIDGILTDSRRRWTPKGLFDKAQAMFPDLTTEEFADRLRKADQGRSSEYLTIGLGPKNVRSLQQRLEVAADSLAPQQQRVQSSQHTEPDNLDDWLASGSKQPISQRYDYQFETDTNDKPGRQLGD